MYKLILAVFALSACELSDPTETDPAESTPPVATSKLSCTADRDPIAATPAPAVVDAKLRRGDAKRAELAIDERAAWTPPPHSPDAQRALADYVAASARITDAGERAALKQSMLAMP